MTDSEERLKQERKRKEEQGKIKKDPTSTAIIISIATIVVCIIVTGIYVEALCRR